MELTVWAHDPSDPEVYVDPALLNASEGDVAELWLPHVKAPETRGGETRMRRSSHRASIGSKVTTRSSSTPENGKGQRKNMYFHIKKPKTSGSTSLPTISVSSKVLQTLGIRPRSQVKVKVLEPHQLRKTELDVVEIHFKGVYLTRNDHYRIAKSLHGRCVHSCQRIKYLNDSVRLTVETLFQGGHKRFSGFIGEDTRVVFRSDSARILIFIHMTSEMWNFDETGDIMFHRLVNSFIPEMLHKWHTQGDSHLVSLVLFTSVSDNAFARLKSKENGGRLGEPVVGNLRSGMLEKETHHFYRVVVDSTPISRWSDIMSTLRIEFERFPKEVLEDPDTHEIRGYFLPSSKSNILEALSLATTLLTSKFVDRDLCRTGVQAMIATAGQACFDVDLSDLWYLSRRLLGVEIGIELVCLARPPLHVTPLFRALLTNEGENNGVEPYRLVFVVPKWINMSFWSSPYRYRQQWIPRCRIYDSQMVGLIENEARTLGLKSFSFEPNEINGQFMRHFDASVFKSVEMIESQKRIEHTAKTATSLELRPKTTNLKDRTTAMAITTKATATPTVVSFSGSGVQSSAETQISSSSISIPSPNPSLRAAQSFLSLRDSILSSGPQVSSELRNDNQSLAPKRSTVSAKHSLGALLGPKARNGIKGNAFNSDDSRRAITIDSHLLSANTVNVPKTGLRETNGSDSGHNDFDDIASSPVPKLEAPIYIKTPAHADRRDSKLSKNSMKRSPSLRWSTSTNSPWNGRASVSPEREKLMSRSPVSGGAQMCDTSHPELDNPSMWRVLPNSATIDNPSRVVAYGRWANVYPPKKRINGVSWHSLKSPASLPITSESSTSLSTFKEQYQFQFYDVAVDSEEISLPDLLDEMIGLRLQMGFQIVVGPNIRAIEASLPRGNPNRVVAIVPRDAKECIGVRVYMTRVGLIHRLAVDDDRLINVRLYTWIQRNSKRLSCPLNQGRHEDVKVKTKYSDQYLNINKRFFDQGVERLNWSMLDQQVSGADDPLLYPSSANTQNLVTIRYVLIPSKGKISTGPDDLTVEEGRVEGITRMVRTLLRHREAGSIDSDFIVHYYTGKLSQAIGEIVSESSSSLEANRLNKSISLEDLAGEMQGAMGITFRDRRWHWKHYKHVFTGHNFVVWLMKTFEDINTTEEAESYGADLMRRGLFKHPENRHPFLHGHYFYVLLPEYDKSHGSETSSVDYGDDSTSLEFSSAGSTAQNSASNSRSGTPIHGESRTNSPKPEGDEPRGNNYDHPPVTSSIHNSPKNSGARLGSHEASRAKVHVSESFVINVDPRKISGRVERAKVSIDRLHNPKNAFHIVVEWLSVTPRLVDDLFSGIGRMVSQYGLRLVQVPVTDVSGSIEDSPFRSAMIMELNVETKNAAELRWFRHFLLQQAGYVLDIHDREDITNDEYEVLFLWGKLRSAAPQYIHSSGYVLVQMADERHLYVTANTLHVSRAVLAGNLTSSADGESEILMEQLRTLCADRSRLEAMLRDARRARNQKHGGLRLAHKSVKSDAPPSAR